MKILKNYAAKAIKQLNINLWYSRPESRKEAERTPQKVSNKTNECVPDVDDDVDVRRSMFDGIPVELLLRLKIQIRWKIILST